MYLVYLALIQTGRLKIMWHRSTKTHCFEDSDKRKDKFRVLLYRMLIKDYVLRYTFVGGKKCGTTFYWCLLVFLFNLPF